MLRLLSSPPSLRSREDVHGAWVGFKGLLCSVRTRGLLTRKGLDEFRTALEHVTGSFSKELLLWGMLA